MEAVGIICEYNPLHNGHLHHIEEIRKLFPGKTIILVLNGYFLERGEVSILSKENKTKLALIYGVDLIVELPFIFGSQSADIFADAAIKILGILGCSYLVFGSESNDIKTLEKVAKTQDSPQYNEKVKELLATGINYPTALSKALDIDVNVFNPNDLLGISYIKAIYKNKFNIKPVTIKRTSDYHSLEEESNIISASNIRNKLKQKESITNYVPRKTIKLIENISLEDLFPFIKYKILTDMDLSKYLTVDEGIENRLKDVDLKINLTDKARTQLINDGYDINYGARPLKREVSKTIDSLLAHLLVKGTIKYGETVIFDVVDNELRLVNKED